MAEQTDQGLVDAGLAVHEGWDEMRSRTGLSSYDSQLSYSEFHPHRVLNSVHRSLDFLGHGASKWTSEKQKFVDMLLHLEDGGERCGVRMLVLDPMSDICRETSKRLFPKDPHRWPIKILRSLQTLGALEEVHDNLEVKVYKHKPIFRLTIIDGVSVTIGHYRNYHRDSQASPLLIFHKGPKWTFFTPFQLLYDREWNAASPVDWQAVADRSAELGIERPGS